MVQLDRTTARSSLSDKLIEASTPPMRNTMRKRQRIKIRTPANRFGDEGEIVPPDGMTYEWKVMTVHGQPATEQITEWKLNGWTEVPAGRHPDFTGAKEDSTEAILRGGQVLCERPKELTEESRQMEKDAAKNQVDNQLERLQLRARETKSRRATKIERIVEAIPDDIAD